MTYTPTTELRAAIEFRFRRSSARARGTPSRPACGFSREEKVTLITDRKLRCHRSRVGARAGRTRLRVERLRAGRARAAAAEGHAAAVLEDMESSQVSIFAVEVQPNELRSRMQMTDVVNRRHMRHAHMVNITPEIMVQGMRADFDAVDRLSQAVLDKVRKASYVRATTAAGTDIRAELDPDYRWFKTSGIISPEKWGNLPGGECFTAPGEVNGVFVVDGVVGDFLCARYGILRDTPLTIHIRRTASPRSRARTRSWSRSSGRTRTPMRTPTASASSPSAPTSASSEVIGNILQDEKFPGIHIAFGDPYGAHTGAPWKSSTHIDVVGLGFNIWLGDAEGEQQIMRDGEFLDRSA